MTLLPVAMRERKRAQQFDGAIVRGAETLEIRADLAARTLNITAAGMLPASAPLPAKMVSMAPIRDAAIK